MNKLKMHSPNLTEENIAKLRELFPSCVTEAKDDNGSIRATVDFDQLRQELNDHIVEGPQERYQLNWPGKREALFAANAPIAKTLRVCREESVNFDTTKNLFIEGDNLEALKLLQETYLGEVKLIYIDPPYNTGNDFVYEDDFSEDVATYLHRSNQTDEVSNRLIANPDTNGRFHSDWLSMMYPRLRLARNLLRDDGAIFISVDDGEVHNLRKLCDEVFGEQNFKANVVWQKRYTRSNNTVDFTTVVEHIVVYARSSAFVVNLLPRTEEADARYTNPDSDHRGVWKGASFLNPATPKERPNLCYPITNPNTGQITLPTSNAWRRSLAEFQKLQEDKRLYWGIDGKQPVPSIKMFLSEARGLTPINFWEHGYAGNTDEGTRDLAEILGPSVFNNPKPVRLIRRIIEHACGRDSLIMDFFSGSGTTAQAVLATNAEDGGSRRFVLVQLPEPLEAGTGASEGDRKTIADIGKERIRRAGAKVLEDAVSPEWDKDVGFRCLKIDTSAIADVFYRPDAVKQANLLDAVDNIKPGRDNPEDLLFQVLVDWGVDLTLPIRKETVKDKTVFFVNAEPYDLIACFDKGVTEDLVKELAKHKPMRIVFRDNGFESDAVKINVDQIFRQLSPSTDVKSI